MGRPAPSAPRPTVRPRLRAARGVSGLLLLLGGLAGGGGAAFLRPWDGGAAARRRPPSRGIQAGPPAAGRPHRGGPDAVRRARRGARRPELGAARPRRDAGRASRSAALARIARHAAALLALRVPSGRAREALAFEGGVGGLGKTKPQTGVRLWDEASPPLQTSAGAVAAELDVAGRPVLVTFAAPWPLLPTTAGLEVRDLQNSESAFVQVVAGDGAKSDPTTKAGMLQFLLDSVLSQHGKFGAYGAPMDVKVQQFVVETGRDGGAAGVTCAVPFTTFTPGLRESERQLLVRAVRVGARSSGGSWILWVVGTTRLRFAAQRPVLQQVLESFRAVPAPASNRSPSRALSSGADSL